MTNNQWLQIGFFFAMLLLLVKPLGTYMAQVYGDKPFWGERFLGWLEKMIYRVGGVKPGEPMDWKAYALALLVFNAVGGLILYLILRLQNWLPLNPAGQPSVPPDLSFNTAISFITNTNWQNYGGESTLSYFTQMAGLAVHNFLSAAGGMAVLVAFLRGFTRKETSNLGNFWVDLTRSVVYILLPLCLVYSLVLISQGVPQTFGKYQDAALLQPTSYDQPVTDAQGVPVTVKGQPQTAPVTVTDQTLALGPVASQLAVKMLGTNGGGFYNANSSHPYENPTPFSNLLEMLSLTAISAAFCYAFGVLVGDRRQGWAVLLAMLLLLVPMVLLCVHSEQAGNPALSHLTAGKDGVSLADGNMEGKEVRFGVVNSGLFATLTTATSCGAVNSMHDSFTPLGGFVPLWMLSLGEVVLGGVGSGLYVMLVFVVVAVFVAGLMVGRTPEYLGKKIQAFEMKMASMVILIPPILILVFTAIGVETSAGQAGPENPGAHGFSEILYAFSSQVANNGSAFAGLTGNTHFYNLLGAVAMWLGRFWLAIPALAIAGSLAQKKIVPATGGTLPTHNLLFITLLVSTVVIVGALTFFPALALGPIVEHLKMAHAVSN
ncbi:MAG TPA: potassium-transporting ATPase subunit KdpA [bacterium]|nr:potassium-transporting ATPase subunit KdpA [bacterium]